MRVAVTSALILSIASSTLGYLVKRPQPHDIWRCGENQTISWDWVDTDAKSFCIELSDGSSSINLARNIARKQGSTTIRVPQAASGQRVNLVACRQGGSRAIYAQSGQLEIVCSRG